MNIPSWHKIFTYGDRFTKGILDGEVEITEKIDGSQFTFGRTDKATVLMRSKGAEIFFGDGNKMFNKAKEYVMSIQAKLPTGVFFHGEYLQKPKHNTLEYARVPKNNFMLFGVTVRDTLIAKDTYSLDYWAHYLDCEAVPIIYKGNMMDDFLMDYDTLLKLIPEISILGNCKAEGIVIKNYAKSLMVGDVAVPIMQAKIVCNEFKEKHGVSWGKENPTNMQKIGESLNSEARWLKAVQYKRDNNELTETVKDIGPLIGRIKQDILEEEKENIKEMLYKLFKEDILRMAINGFPEWYKKKLADDLSAKQDLVYHHGIGSEI